MGTPDLLGTYGTFAFYTSEPYAFAGQTLSGGVVHPVQRQRRRRARDARGPGQPVSSSSRRRCSAEFTAHLDRDQPARQDRRRRARSACWRSASGATGCRCSFPLAPTQSLQRRGPVLPQEPRSVLRALRQPGQHRSAGPGDAGVASRPIRGGTREATGRFYTQGMPEDTKGLKTGVLTEDRVPGAGADRRRREPAAVPLRARSVHRRPALLLLRQRRSGLAHDVARARSGASRLRRRHRHAATPASSRSSTRGSTRSSARRWRGSGPDDLLVVMSDHGFTSWRRAFHLNSWLRDNGYLRCSIRIAPDDPGLLRQRGLVAHPRLRASA